MSIWSRFSLGWFLTYFFASPVVVGIELHDYEIINKNGYYSFSDEGIL